MLEKLNFDDKGLVPAVIQDSDSGDVLTLCYMNKDALLKTVQTGKVHVWRRSKGRLMMKGETSGCVQKVISIAADCEWNSVLVRVEQKGVACHTGEWTCYFKKVWPGSGKDES